MAKFTNLSVTSVEVTDENGITYHFDGGEERGGLSNYFAHYTSAYLTRPILALVGELDGDGLIPAPAIRNENTMFQPGPGVPYAFTAAPTDAATPAVAPVSIASTTPPRKRSMTVDMQNEEADARRRVDSRFVGIETAPTLRHLTVDLAATGLNAASTYTAETGYFPLAANGLKATAADAAANPAVEEGVDYTAFGTIVTTDASPSQSGTFYYSIKGTSDIVFVAADDNPASLPDPVVSGSAIVLATGVLTLAAFTGGAAGDSNVVTMNASLYPDTAAKMAAVLGALDSYRSGLYRNPVSGRLFIVDGTTVNAFNADASATVS